MFELKFIIVSNPGPLIIPIAPFRFLPKICKDIRNSRCSIGVNYTNGKYDFFKQTIVSLVSIWLLLKLKEEFLLTKCYYADMFVIDEYRCR
jgi:hypothetical protein